MKPKQTKIKIPTKETNPKPSPVAKSCVLKLELEPEVDARLRLLCKQRGLPYPKGIAEILDAALARKTHPRKKGGR